MALDFTQTEGSWSPACVRLGDQAALRRQIPLQVCPVPGDLVSRAGVGGLEPHVELWPLSDAAESLEDIFSVIARQATRLLGVELAGVIRFETSNIGWLVGICSTTAQRFAVGTRLVLGGDTASAIVQRTGRPARVESYAALGDPRARYLSAHAYQGGAAAPIYVGTHLWGALGVATTRHATLPGDVEARLAGLAELVALTLANSDPFLRFAHQALLDTLLQKTPVGLGVVDPELRYVHINAGLAEIHGRLATQDLGRRFDEVVPDLASQLEERCFGPVLETGTAVLDVEVSGETSAQPGTRCHWLVSCYPARIGRDETPGIGVVMLDITDRKRSEDERGRLLQAEHAARTRAEAAEASLGLQNARLVELDQIKDELVAFVSHELRTPLQTIRGYLELLLDDDGDSHPGTEQREYLEIIERNSHRLMRLASDLLVVAQADAGRLDLIIAEVDLHTVARECLANSKPHADAANITLIADLEDRVVVPGDRMRLGELLDNLVSNAIKFTPADGQVTIRAGVRNGFAKIEVHDTGRGIPLGQQRQLFDRFFRVPDHAAKPVPGVGLGLSIARMIAEAHGGRIGVESTEGSAACFWVELPAIGPRVDAP